MNDLQKPVIGITCGDVNGIGLELIIKSLADNRITDICTPVVFGNNKAIQFYRKLLPEYNLVMNVTRDITKLNVRQVNLLNVWEEDITITPGELNSVGGKYALLSLEAGVKALKEGKIQGLVTAPIHKKNIQSEAFKHSGHTPYLKEMFEAKDVLMLMVAENMKVGVVTEHVPVQEVAKLITKQAILSKLQVLKTSLQQDFGIDKPVIAVLGLNPHAGDGGLIGKEEETIIKPAIKEAKQSMMVFGPYSADAFFAKGQHERVDAVLAMYHDQGLIPFKAMSLGEGVNFTAGLPAVRTSPDHGTAFDIAGKNKANQTSFLAAIFSAVDIYNTRNGYKEARKNPIRRVSDRFLANVVDEKIEE